MFDCNFAVIALRHVRKQKRCAKCGRFLSEDYTIERSWIGLRKKYKCWPGCCFQMRRK